jgi:hypothetical protein
MLIASRESTAALLVVTSVRNRSSGPSIRSVMSVPLTSVLNSTSNSGTIRDGLANEIAPRSTWKVLPARYTSPPSASVTRPASTGSLTVPMTRMAALASKRP